MASTSEQRPFRPAISNCENHTDYFSQLYLRMKEEVISRTPGFEFMPPDHLEDRFWIPRQEPRACGRPPLKSNEHLMRGCGHVLENSHCWEHCVSFDQRKNQVPTSCPMCGCIKCLQLLAEEKAYISIRPLVQPLAIAQEGIYGGAGVRDEDLAEQVYEEIVRTIRQELHQFAYLRNVHLNEIMKWIEYQEKIYQMNENDFRDLKIAMQQQEERFRRACYNEAMDWITCRLTEQFCQRFYHPITGRTPLQTAEEYYEALEYVADWFGEPDILDEFLSDERGYLAGQVPGMFIHGSLIFSDEMVEHRLFPRNILLALVLLLPVMQSLRDKIDDAESITIPLDQMPEDLIMEQHTNSRGGYRLVFTLDPARDRGEPIEYED